MRRLTIVGLSMVLTLLFAPTALASGETGELVLETRGGQGAYYTGRGIWVFGTSSEGRISVTTPTSGVAGLAFYNVELGKSGVHCNTPGYKSGLVNTNLLSVETGWIKRLPNPLVGIDFKPLVGSYLAEFECGNGLKVKWKGSIIAEISPANNSGLQTITDFRPNAGRSANSPESFEGGPRDVLISEFSSGGQPEESALQEENLQTVNHGQYQGCERVGEREVCHPDPYEINTIANPVQPEFGRCKKVTKGTGKFAEANCASLVVKGNYEFEPV
jgi:hypothetical protein